MKTSTKKSVLNLNAVFSKIFGKKAVENAKLVNVLNETNAVKEKRMSESKHSNYFLRKKTHLNEYLSGVKSRNRMRSEDIKTNLVKKEYINLAGAPLKHFGTFSIIK